MVDPVDPVEQAVACAAARYAADHTSRALDIQIIDVTPGAAAATMVVTEAVINGHGTCHGDYVSRRRSHSLGRPLLEG